MNTEKQLNLWDIGTDSKEAAVLKELTDLKEKQNNLRRGLFQRYDKMQKEIECLKEEILQMKQAQPLSHAMGQ